MIRTFSLVALTTLSLLFGCDSGGDAVSGTITLGPEVKATPGASDMLFITARQAGENGGPPLAVLKMVGIRFPLTYTIGQEDVIRPGQFFKGDVVIQATLRKSGFADMPVPGDARGAYKKNPVPVGATAVDFALDQVVK